MHRAAFQEPQRCLSQCNKTTTFRRLWHSGEVWLGSWVLRCRLLYIRVSLRPLANRTLNFKLQTPDGETLGAWFILSEPYYRSLSAIPTEVSEHVIPALKERPVILFFHGNAATRAVGTRIRHYQAFSTRLGANVLAIDYRGFADSTGKPSESGLVRDARTAFDWLVAQGKRPQDILIVGNSLGTGVSGQLGAQLAAENINPRGIVLLSVSVSFPLPTKLILISI